LRCCFMAAGASCGVELGEPEEWVLGRGHLLER
jgi:hypothetical protein